MALAKVDYFPKFHPFTVIVLLIVALNGNYWYDIKGADLTDQGFGPNLTLHGGLFRSCGPPLDENSGKTEDCPRFEEVLGPKIQRIGLPYQLKAGF